MHEIVSHYQITHRIIFMNIKVELRALTHHRKIGLR